MRLAELHVVRVFVATIALAILGWVACVRYVAVQAPDSPPAPMIDEGAVQEAMTGMAVRVREIRMIMAAGPPGPAERAELSRLLGEIEQIAGRLSPDTVRGAHPALAFSLDEFLDDVRMAKRAVAANPPDYFLVGTISGACAACHVREARSSFGTGP